MTHETCMFDGMHALQSHIHFLSPRRPRLCLHRLHLLATTTTPPPPPRIGMCTPQEDMLSALQLLVYLNKFPNVCQVFYQPRTSFQLATARRQTRQTCSTRSTRQTRHIPARPAIPVPIPTQTHTREVGHGFGRVWVRVSKIYPWVTRGVH
jgi:hypothetical protein